jgi:hypothetical protein
MRFYKLPVVKLKAASENVFFLYSKAMANHVSTAESPQKKDALGFENGVKKSMTVLPEDESKDSDSKLKDVVEIGIAREMIEANKNPEGQSQSSRKTLKKNVKSLRQALTAKSKIKQRKNVVKKKGKMSLKRKTKRVEIETGHKDQSPFSEIKEITNGVDNVDLQNTGLGPEAGDAISADSIGLKADAFDGLEKDLPDFAGLDNVGDVQKILETPKHKTKKLDYFVEHFSNDPYVAESEREQWMKENDIRPKQYRRRLEKTKQGKRGTFKSL